MKTAKQYFEKLESLKCTQDEAHVIQTYAEFHIYDNQWKKVFHKVDELFGRLMEDWEYEYPNKRF